jgi:hypothetical protein
VVAETAVADNPRIEEVLNVDVKDIMQPFQAFDGLRRRNTPGLPRLERILVLRNWAYDARELEVAEEEGVGGSDASLLKPIRDSLRCLVGALDVEHPACPCRLRSQHDVLFDAFGHDAETALTPAPVIGRTYLPHCSSYS